MSASQGPPKESSGEMLRYEQFKKWLRSPCDAHELAMDEQLNRQECMWCLFEKLEGRQ